MQVLADKGLEFGEHKGFGWIHGTVDRIDYERFTKTTYWMEQHQS